MLATCMRPAFAGLLPHAPVLIPEVAAADQRDLCHVTTDACQELAGRLVAAGPDRVVLVSPHAPRRGAAPGIYVRKRLQGSLGSFGCPWVSLNLPTDTAFVAAFAATAENTAEVRDPGLDHGALVPLWFVADAGWRGPTAVLSLPAGATPAALRAMGLAIARAATSLPGRTALVASGDLTHRAAPGAPGGFHPRAVEFDRQLAQRLRAGDLAGIAAIDAALRGLAAEDAADATAAVAAAFDNRASGPQVLSYQHPFGVGYLVAVLHDGKDAA
ncbi:MAG: hypothetical protein FJ265_19720 [Planctomycetes bacterium]|nr:hypothetical protein [Planctomycetota bacterium]